MDINCTKQELLIFQRIGEAAAQLGLETYLVGGFVRDKIMGRLTNDADIVCVGDGIKLAKAVAKLFDPQPKVSYFKNFGTAHINTPLAVETGDDRHPGRDITSIPFDIEFVGARTRNPGG
ncbi:MAG TPA: hypothetical protein PLV32_13580 [Chitinophagaceae bacterium]|nr:hypothetical protein [Chitinophagaceae bacterium]